MIQKIKISKLVTNDGQIEGLPRNPRLIKDGKFKLLIKSLQEDPEMMDLRELIVCPFQGKFVVIAGNMRLRAAQELKLKEMPCKVLPADTPVEKLKAYTIKDNASFGENDWELLANEWDAGFLEDCGIDLPVDFGASTGDEVEDDKYEAPDTDLIKTDITLGDFFEIGPHRLLCGDARNNEDAKKLFDAYKADLVLTDPPYNVDYTGKTKDALKIQNDKKSRSGFYEFLLAFYKNIYDFSKEGASWYIWHAETEGYNFRKAFIDAGLDIKACLIWVKNSMVMGRQDYQWKHEPCLYGWKPGKAHYFIDDRTQTTVIDDKLNLKKLSKDEMYKLLTEIFSEKIPTTVIYHDRPTRNDVHPTMKPVTLMGYLIKNSSRQLEIVADPFVGSGSTMVAAHQLQRYCFAIELDPRYCAVTIDRMAKFAPELPMKRNGKPYEAPAELIKVKT